MSTTNDSSPGLTHRTDEDSLAVAIAREVATRENTDVTALPPLYESIDIEAVTSLCRSLDDGQMTFAHQGYRITVESTMQFTVEPI